MKDREFADFVGLVRQGGVLAPAINALKLLGFSHVVHVTSGTLPGLGDRFQGSKNALEL